MSLHVTLHSAAWGWTGTAGTFVDRNSPDVAVHSGLLGDQAPFEHVMNGGFGYPPSQVTMHPVGSQLMLLAWVTVGAPTLAQLETAMGTAL